MGDAFATKAFPCTDRTAVRYVQPEETSSMAPSAPAVSSFHMLFFLLPIAYPDGIVPAGFKNSCGAAKSQAAQRVSMLPMPVKRDRAPRCALLCPSTEAVRIPELLDF